jgi:hypothetical protein
MARKNYFSFLLLLIPISATVLSVNAQTPNLGSLLDTGSQDNFEDDYRLYWPEKIIVDTSVSTLMLIWFDTDATRNTQLKFEDVSDVRILSNYQSHQAELQLILKDGRKFLMGTGNKADESAAVLSAVVGKRYQQGKKSDPRILPKTPEGGFERRPPVLVLGSISAPDAFNPPAGIKKEDTSNKIYLEGKDSAIGESIGSDISTVEKSGKVNKNDVNMVIKGEMSRFKTCYQREYVKNPQLSGKVTLRFMINKEGKVEGAEIKDSTLNNVLVERCMLKQIYGISFAKPGNEPVIISYPFVFSGK